MVVAAIGTVFAAAYLLWLYQRTAFGEPNPEFVTHDAHGHDPHGHGGGPAVARSVSAAANEDDHADIHDVGLYEWISWTPLLGAILLFGVWPNLMFKVFDPAVQVALKAFGG
jgi:NADH-quinone oxidoreductase subunit M